MYSLPKGCNTLRTFCYDLKFGQLTLVAKRQSQSADLKKNVKTIVCYIIALFYCPFFMHYFIAPYYI